MARQVVLANVVVHAAVQALAVECKVIILLLFIEHMKGGSILSLIAALHSLDSKQIHIYCLVDKHDFPVAGCQIWVSNLQLSSP